MIEESLIHSYLKPIASLGLPTVALVFLAVYGKKFLDKIIEYNQKREEALMKFLENDLKDLSEVQNRTADTIKETRKASDEAHKYQREEHSKFIEQHEEIMRTLVKLNGKLEG